MLHLLLLTLPRIARRRVFHGKVCTLVSRATDLLRLIAVTGVLAVHAAVWVGGRHLPLRGVGDLIQVPGWVQLAGVVLQLVLLEGWVRSVLHGAILKVVAVTIGMDLCNLCG